MDLRRLQRLLAVLNPERRPVLRYSVGPDDTITLEFGEPGPPQPAQTALAPPPPQQAPEKKPDRYSTAYLRQRLRSGKGNADGNGEN